MKYMERYTHNAEDPVVYADQIKEQAHKWTPGKESITKTHSKKLYSLVIEPKKIYKPTRRAFNSRNREDREDCEDCDSPFGESNGH